MLSLLIILAGSAQEPPHPPRAAAEKDPPPSWLRVDRGDGRLPLLVPRDEELTFRVVIDVPVLGDIEAGKVVLSSGVERYVAGLPAPDSPPPRKPLLETGWIRSVATGGYAGYNLWHELHTRRLPQEWPRVFYTDTQRGSENRRREVRIGRFDGRLVAQYRHDGHCKGCSSREHFLESKWLWGKAYHCPKCKLAEHRLWKEPVSRTVPDGTVDMLSAVYLARALVREGENETSFPLIDKQELWDVFLKRGKRKRIEVAAGRFDCVQVEMRTQVPKDEPAREGDFQGMFGLRGSIKMWMGEKSGVPVMIQGEIHVPVIGGLDVQIELVSHSGTASDFGSR